MTYLDMLLAYLRALLLAAAIVAGLGVVAWVVTNTIGGMR